MDNNQLVKELYRISFAIILFISCTEFVHSANILEIKAAKVKRRTTLTIVKTQGTFWKYE